MIKERIYLPEFEDEIIEISLEGGFKKSLHVYHNGEWLRQVNSDLDSESIFHAHFRNGEITAITAWFDEGIVIQVNGTNKKHLLPRLTECHKNHNKRFDVLFLSLFILIMFIWSLNSIPKSYTELRSWEGNVVKLDLERQRKTTYNMVYIKSRGARIKLFSPSQSLKVGDELSVKAEYNEKLNAYKIRELRVNGHMTLSYGASFVGHIFSMFLIFISFVVTLTWGIHRFKKYSQHNV